MLLCCLTTLQIMVREDRGDPTLRRRRPVQCPQLLTICDVIFRHCRSWCGRTGRIPLCRGDSPCTCSPDPAPLAGCRAAAGRCGTCGARLHALRSRRRLLHSWHTPAIKALWQLLHPAEHPFPARVPRPRPCLPSTCASPQHMPSLRFAQLVFHGLPCVCPHPVPPLNTGPLPPPCSSPSSSSTACPTPWPGKTSRTLPGGRVLRCAALAMLGLLRPAGQHPLPALGHGGSRQGRLSSHMTPNEPSPVCTVATAAIVSFLAGPAHCPYWSSILYH